MPAASMRHLLHTLLQAAEEGNERVSFGANGLAEGDETLVELLACLAEESRLVRRDPQVKQLYHPFLGDQPAGLVSLNECIKQLLVTYDLRVHRDERPLVLSQIDATVVGEQSDQTVDGSTADAELTASEGEVDAVLELAGEEVHLLLSGDLVHCGLLGAVSLLLLLLFAAPLLRTFVPLLSALLPLRLLRRSGDASVRYTAVVVVRRRLPLGRLGHLLFRGLPRRCEVARLQTNLAGPRLGQLARRLCVSSLRVDREVLAVRQRLRHCRLARVPHDANRFQLEVLQASRQLLQLVRLQRKSLQSLQLCKVGRQRLEPVVAQVEAVQALHCGDRGRKLGNEVVREPESAERSQLGEGLGELFERVLAEVQLREPRPGSIQVLWK
mmetsp:Transcript_16208/g.63202  ORF Transcript_16208/g.63202 Transcript_16208/m.63202 type:complete len:384 (-) Transcript_16208:750-1901(-)